MNRRLLLVATLVVFASVLIGQRLRPAETRAAGRQSEIQGSVTDGQGGPLAGWRVLIGTDECKLISSTLTDAHGAYRFTDLDPGSYAVELAFDQPHGQGWLPVSIPWTGGSCGGGISVVAVNTRGTASGPAFKANLINDPRGYFGNVFNDANENGKRDASEGAFRTIVRQRVSDTFAEFATDMEGNFRVIESATPIPGNPVSPELNLSTCPAYPVEGDNPTGYRFTTPVPNSCGRWGCATKVSDQVFRCQDFGLYLVDPDPSYFIGEVWENAAPVAPGSLVTAWIGDTDCGEGYVWGNGVTTRYDIIVHSAKTRAGCGTEGAEVRFTLNGGTTPAVGQWHVRTMQSLQQVLDIVIGPPFAVYDVQIVTTATDRQGDRSVQAYVGDIICAEGTASRAGMIPYPGTRMVVPPESLRAGCGKEGATVRFVVDGVAYSPTQSWTPGTHRVQLTAAPVVTLPTTGSGGFLPH
jgi:hypothetical protein